LLFEVGVFDGKGRFAMSLRIFSERTLLRPRTSCVS